MDKDKGSEKIKMHEDSSHNVLLLEKYIDEQQVTIKRLQKHLDYEMEEHIEKTFEMLEFMKEKGVFDEYYERVKKEVLDDE